MLFFLFLTSAHSLFLHGFSLAGDVRYAPRKLGAAWSGSRLFLHAAYVATSSESPWSLTAVSPIPHELQELLRMVGADDELLQSLGEIASLQKALPTSFVPKGKTWNLILKRGIRKQKRRFQMKEVSS